MVLLVAHLSLHQNGVSIGSAVFAHKARGREQQRTGDDKPRFAYRIFLQQLPSSSSGCSAGNAAQLMYRYSDCWTQVCNEVSRQEADQDERRRDVGAQRTNYAVTRQSRGQQHCTLCLKKNDNDVLRYNFNAHQLILIIFGRDIAE